MRIVACAVYQLYKTVKAFCSLNLKIDIIFVDLVGLPERCSSYHVVQVALITEPRSILKIFQQEKQSGNVTAAGKPASETSKSTEEKVSEKQKVLYAQRHKVFYKQFFFILLPQQQ